MSRNAGNAKPDTQCGSNDLLKLARLFLLVYGVHHLVTVLHLLHGAACMIKLVDTGISV